MQLNDPMKSFLDSFSVRGRELFLCCVDVSFDESITNMLWLIMINGMSQFY